MRILLSFIILLFISSNSYAEENSVYDRVMKTGKVVCGFFAWPPFYEVNPNTKEVSGFTKDISDKIFELINVKVEYKEIQLGSHVADLNEGKIDVMCGDGPWVISTVKHIDYSKPFLYAPVYLYGREDESRVDFNDKSVKFVGIDGDLSIDLKNLRFPEASLYSMSSLTDPAQLMLNVTTGKADVTITDSMIAANFIRNNPDKLKKLISGDPIAVYGMGLSVRKSEQKFLNILNQAVEAAINTGIVDSILNEVDPEGNLLRVRKSYEVKK